MSQYSVQVQRQGKSLYPSFEALRQDTLTWGMVSLFVQFRLSADRTRPTHIGGEDNLLYSFYPFYPFKCQFHLKSPHRNTRIMFDHISGHPGAQSS